MALEYSTCRTASARKSSGNGSGKIFVPSSYGGDGGHANDSCADVDVGDCPTGYKHILRPGQSDRYFDGGNDTHELQGSEMRDNLCWHSGFIRGNGVARDDEEHMENAPWGESGATVTGRGYRSSFDGVGTDNYGKPCFKDANGWVRTNPDDGTPNMGNYNSLVEWHADSCCGFKDGSNCSEASCADDTNKSEIAANNNLYCDPRYCFTDGSSGMKLSRECRSRLIDKCGEWSFAANEIGFEHDMCNTPTGQKADSLNRKVSELTNTMVNQANAISGSINEIDYKNIGKTLCTESVFTDTSNTGNARQKREKCINWCKNEPGECRNTIRSVCARIFEQYKNIPDLYSDNIDDYDDICACNWPEEFYDSIRDFYKETYEKVEDHHLSGDRKCLYGNCENLTKIEDPDDSGNDCANPTFVSCTQELDFDFTGASMGGNVVIDATSSQECGSFADSGAGNNDVDDGGEGGSEGGSEGGESKDEDNTTLVSVSVFIFLMVIILFAVVAFYLI